MTVDSRRPVAVRQTAGTTFQAGIGPHTETATVLPLTQDDGVAPDLAQAA
jgi:hypothetical protein